MFRPSGKQETAQANTVATPPTGVYTAPVPASHFSISLVLLANMLRFTTRAGTRCAQAFYSRQFFFGMVTFLVKGRL
jgi:hypothetical protein